MSYKIYLENTFIVKQMKRYLFELTFRLIYSFIFFLFINYLTLKYSNDLILFLIIKLNYSLNLSNISFLILKIFDIIYLPIELSIILSIYFLIPFVLFQFFFFLLTGCYKNEIQYFIITLVILLQIQTLILPLCFQYFFFKILLNMLHIFRTSKYILAGIKIQPDLTNYILIFFYLYTILDLVSIIIFLILVNQYLNVFTISNISTLILYKYEIYSSIFCIITLLTPPDMYFLTSVFIIIVSSLELNFYINFILKTYLNKTNTNNKQLELTGIEPIAPKCKTGILPK